MSDPATESIPSAPPQGWSEAQLMAEAQQLAHVGFSVYITATGRLWWSDETYRIFGCQPQEFPITIERFLEFVVPEDLDHVAAVVAHAVDNAEPYDFQHGIVRPDGSQVYVRARGRVTRGDDGLPERMIGVVFDVTDEVVLQKERDRAVRDLSESETRHRLLAENAWDVVWTMGVDGSITYVSPSVERMRGITAEEAAAQTLDQIHPPDSAAKVTAYFTQLYAAMAAGEVPPIYHGEREYYRKDGSIMYGELQVIPQVDESGNVVQILGVTRDISDRKEMEDELRHLAVTDPLTGIWNRRQGEKLINEVLVEADSQPALSLLMVDVDHFKYINDTVGHQSGDQVLIELARVIRDNLRASDVLTRWGGEEFVILMQQCGIKDAIHRAESLRALIESRSFDDGVKVTVSIGVAEVDSDDDLAACLRRADVAMYQA